MASRTPIPVSRSMKRIAENLDLARRQQRIKVALLADRAGVSEATVRRLLREGQGTVENLLRVSRVLGMLDNIQEATDPLGTEIGRLRADQDTPLRVRGR